VRFEWLITTGECLTPEEERLIFRQEIELGYGECKHSEQETVLTKERLRCKRLPAMIIFPHVMELCVSCDLTDFSDF